MSDRQREQRNRLAEWQDELEGERRLRGAAVTKAMGTAPDPEVEAADEAAEEGARARIDQQTAWVDRLGIASVITWTNAVGLSKGAA